MTFKVISEKNKTCQVGDNNNMANNTAIDKSYSGTVTIPSQVNGYTVTSIYERAFYYCSGLSGITIPNSVTSIGQSAFEGCSALSGITIPNSVTNIGILAFRGCRGLSSITIPNSVTSIGNMAFEGCHGLTSIIVESENKKYDSRNNCNAIIETATNTLIRGCGSTIIPNSVTSIGISAFDGYRNLTSITIPNSVTSIGNDAFSYCSSLTSITIPKSVTSIGGEAFLYCSSLTRITIPNSVTSIGRSAFEGCSRLTKVRIEKEKPIAIESNTFTNRANATLYVPKGSMAAYQAADYWKEFKEIVEYEVDEIITFADANVKAICVQNWDTNKDGELSKGEAAAVTYLGFVFTSNKSITSFDELQYFSALTSIDISAFKDCSGLTSITIPNSVTSIENYAFYNCNLSSVTLPNALTSIEFVAFADCSSLKSITIPQSVMSIRSDAFENCSGLTSIVVETGNEYYDSRDNCNAIIHTSSNTLILGCKNTLIPNSVTDIGVCAFTGCSGLTSIIIPNSVTSIGRFAFHNCSGLTSIKIPKSVTNIAYDDDGDYSENPFVGCSGLTNITVESGNSTYDSRDGCNAIIKTADNVLVSGCMNTIIPNSVTTIGVEAFAGCSKLTSLAIPGTVTVIYPGAFNGCKKLMKLKVGMRRPLFMNNSHELRTETTLYVPKGCKAAYQAADYWEEFKEIIEFPNTDVNQDGVSNVVDVVDIARYVVGNPIDSFDDFLADINNDYLVSIADAVALVNEIAGNTNFAKAFFTPKKTITADEHLTLTENRDHSLSLSMENSSDYTAFQFDLLMNSNMDVMQMQLNNSRKNGHQLLFNKVGDGHYRVVALSTSNNSFNGNAGELLNFQLDGFNTEGLTVSDIHFYTSRGGNKQFDDLTVQGGTTAIDLQHAEEKLGTDAVYDLQGRKQSTLKRGVNIVNGKKVMVK